MKQKYLLTLSALTTLFFMQPVYAVLTGPYGAVGLGPTRILIPGGNVFNPEVMNGYASNWMGDVNGKIMIGYNFYRFFGLEMSFANYSSSQYSAYVPDGPSAHLNYTMSALNIVGKGYIPLPLNYNTGFKFDPYGIVGLSEVWSNLNYMNSGVPFYSNFNAADFTIGNTPTSSLRPIFGGGINYDVPNTKVSLGVEFTRISGVGNIKTNSRAIPSAEMVTMNVSYNFSSNRSGPVD